MLITYLIVLLIAVTFKVMHFPGTGLLFLISPLFPLIDIVLQSIRKKGDRETRILSAVGVFFLSVFLLFKFLSWSGFSIWFWLATIVLLIYLFRFYQKKIKRDLRFFLIALLILFSTFNFSLKSSSFTLTYLLEDPFDSADSVPHFYRQRLAREFYFEGEFDKSEELIQRNVDHITILLEEENVSDYMREMDKHNFEISRSDLEQIKNRSWNQYTPLYPEDRPSI